MKNISYDEFRILTLVLLCSLFYSCIKNADNNESPYPPINPAEEKTDSTTVIIDSLFKTPIEYMYGEWMAQYTGYDTRQAKTSLIRRVVVFSPDGSYDFHVQGIMDITDTINFFKDFEHEHGTYSFDTNEQIMSYTIEYDSLLNFASDELEFNSGKMQPGVGLITEYKERIWFSKENEGKRDWIRKDDNLVSPDDHSANIIYIMKRK